MKLFLLSFICFFCISCQSKVNDYGGNATIISSKEVISTDGNKIKESTKIIVDQPDNAEKTATIRYKDIVIGSGSSFNTAAIRASFSNISIVTYTGVSLVVLAGLIFVFSKQLKWSLGIGGTGLLLIILSHVLPQYPFIFLLGIIIFIIYLIYTLRDRFIKAKAVEENVKFIEALKPKISPEDKQNAFKIKGGLADITQSSSTKKEVEKIRKKIK